MTPADFLNEIVIPNVAALSDNVGDLRLAVNAVLTLDALAGVIHADLCKRGLEAPDDAAFRDTLAARHVEYGLVRDAAFALKHGELRGKKPRLVQRAEQVTPYSATWDQAVWDRSAASIQTTAKVSHSITSKKPVPPASVPESAASSLSALQKAAEGGHPVAQWKLGRMYADGDGVVQDDLRAFEYFRRIADTHAEDSPSAPQAAIVANAFVALGRYYLTGIPNSSIKADPERARKMFSYAASYFGDADARLYLKESYNRAMASASDDDLARALQMLREYLRR
jgi:hypothetical protein